MVGTAVAVAVLVAGMVLAPRWWSNGPTSTVVAPAATGGPSTFPADPAPTGWRTEYFRDVSFQVPADWRYAYAPGPDWCVDGSSEPAPWHRRPYVSLGEPNAIRDIGCPPFPDRLLTEHVAIVVPDSRADVEEGASRRGPWWLVTRVFDSAVLTATSQDRALAERIVRSATQITGETPCPANSPVQGAVGARPDHGVDVRALDDADHVVLCQYDPDFRGPGGHEPRGLRAKVELSPRQVGVLSEALGRSVPRTSSCSAPSDTPNLAVLVRFWIGRARHEIYVQAAGCDGGVHDGRKVRTLTRAVCQALLVPPIALTAAHGEVGTACLG